MGILGILGLCLVSFGLGGLLGTYWTYRIDYRGHTEFNNQTLEEAEALLGEHKNYHVVDAETKRIIQDLSTLREDQTVLLIPIVAGG